MLASFQTLKTRAEDKFISEQPAPSTNDELFKHASRFQNTLPP
jgi:hypothetical protein